MLTEKNIYSFLKCRAYTNYFKDIFSYSFEYKILSKTLQDVYVYHLKNQSTANIDNFSYQKLLYYFNLEKDNTLLPQQINSLFNKILLKHTSILNILNLENKIPVFGPTFHNYNNGLNLKYKNPCIYRNLEEGYLSYYLSPYSTKFQALNDPIPYLIWSEINSLINCTFDKKMNFTLKVIYPFKDSYDYFNIQKRNNRSLKRLEQILNAYSFDQTPLFDCKYKCKYKNNCKL